MWIRTSEYNWLRSRIDKLESMLEDERKENRRAERHYGNMLLRSAGSYPLPPVREVEKVEPPPRISDNDRAKAEAVIAHGRSINASQQEIADAVRGTVAGWTEAEISAAINVPSNGHG